MKILKVDNRRIAEKLRTRLLKRGMIVAEISKREDLYKDFVKKADIVLFLKGEK
ncbi:hypothetical protein [Hydrogenobacter thermophilus]|uniref:hypothetical protein n=1 Tax=Hydrogenobacter thermophilus TaxID=940 RepID=UPI0030F4FFC2